MIKVSLIVVAGLAAARLLKRQSAATRQWVLAVTVACAAAVPMFERLAPRWTLPAAHPHVHVGASIVSGVALAEVPASPAPTVAVTWMPETPSLGLDRALGVLWLSGSALWCGVLVIGLVRLQLLARRSRCLVEGEWVTDAAAVAAQLGLRRPVTLLQSAHPTVLVTWGVVRPKVMLPAAAQGWTRERRHVVLVHELAHVQRRDALMQFAAELLRAAYWFNPLVSILARRLREESERASDDVVLSTGVAAPAYAGHLLDLARAVRLQRGFTGFPAPAMARAGSFERRVTAMLDTRVNHHSARPATRVALGTVLVAFGLAIGGFGAQAQTFSSFTGSVVDATSREIPAATVALTNIQNRATYHVRSDEAGRFEFVGLPPGEYLVEAEYPGFTRFKADLTIGSANVERNLRLSIGSLTEVVSIRGSRQPATVAPAARPASAPVQRPPAAACQPSATGGNIRAPHKIRNVAPVYPAQLGPDGVSGVVVLEATIAADGTVRDANVVGPAHPDLASAALDAVRQWEYSETLLNCTPVEVAMRATVHFYVE
jgi:TonB family protein